MGEAMVARHSHCPRCVALSEGLPSRQVTMLEHWIAAVAAAPSTEAALRIATLSLAQRFDARRASILVPFGHGALRVIASSDTSMAGDLLIARDRYPELTRVLADQEPLRIADVATSSLLSPVRHLLPAAGVRSLVAVFLRLSGAGAVLRLTSDMRTFTEGDLAALELAAHLLEHEANLPEPVSDPQPWADLVLRLADVVFEVAADGRIIHVHGPVGERFGVEPDAVVGTSFEDHLAPEQIELARRRLLVLLEGSIPVGEPVFDLRLAGGPRRAAHAWGVRVPGAAPRLRVAIRLVEPGESAPQENSIFRGAPVPLLLTDEQGSIADANAAFETLAGVPTAELVGLPLSSLLSERGLEGVLRVGGRSVPVVAHHSPLRGEMVGRTLVALQDLTPMVTVREQAASVRASLESRLAEVDLLQMRLNELDALKVRFLSTSAHELKTPLTVIQTYLDAFLSDLADGLDDEQLEFLQVIHESVLRLRRLVTDLVDLAALESGRIHLVIERVEPADLVAQVVTEMTALAARAGVTLTCTLSDGLAAVRADRDRVVQVLTNLVDNAIKYTHSGGSVTVDGREDGDSVVLDVADTGIGIPQKHLSTIFDEFTSVPRPSSDVRPGSGLGLSICRRLVRAMGGRIAAVSSEVGGSTFSVWLPRWPDEGDVAGA